MLGLLLAKYLARNKIIVHYRNISPKYSCKYVTLSILKRKTTQVQGSPYDQIILIKL